VVIAPVAFASHLVLDALPHFGSRKWWGADFFKQKSWLLMGAVDSVLAILVTVGACLLFPDRAVRILTGSFFAMLPDLFYVPEIFFGVRLDKTLRKFHSWIQWGEFEAGAGIELVWFVAMVALIMRLK
jgi:hypothetical protein